MFVWGSFGNKVFNVEYFERWITLDTIPKGASLTGASDFNDEGNGYITYSNPAGNSVSKLEAYIYDGDDTDTVLVGPKEISKTGTSATLTLTDAERAFIRQRTINKGVSSLVARYYIKTTIGSEVYWSAQVAKMIYITNATPEIQAYFWDVDSSCYDLTQNNEVFIKGYSNLDYTLEATAKKGASISKYTATVDYTQTSTSPLVSGTHDPMWNINKDKIIFTATDNRGLVGRSEQPIYMVDYFAPTCKWELMELEPDKEWVEENGLPADEANNYIKARVEISGKFFNDKFGPNGVANALKVETKHNKLDNEWGEVHEILWGDNVHGNDYKVSFYIRGFYYTDAVSIQFRVSDKLTTQPVEVEERTLTYLPVFDWSKEDFNFNVPLKYKDKDMDFVVDYGTASMGSNGTWYWRKWHSGRAECYGMRNYGNMAVSTAWGGLYESPAFQQDLPSGLFASDPNYLDIQIIESGSAAWIVQGWGAGSLTPTKTSKFSVVSPVSGNISQVWIGFNVVGRWK
jgi:hypothetical protein